MKHFDQLHYSNITAVIPAKKCSSRCPFKNSRKWGDTDLLKNKILMLKSVLRISEIIVSTDDPEAVQISKELDVSVDVREPFYCSDKCSAKELFMYLAGLIKTEHFLYVHCVCPFITAKTVDTVIDFYEQYIDEDNHLQKKNVHDSVVTGIKLKDFLWYQGRAVNYDRFNTPPSQKLPEYFIPSFGCNLLSKEYVLKYGNIMGDNPKFIEVDHIEGIDIDYNYQFIMSELLYCYDFNNTKSMDLVIKNRDKTDHLYLIDCTIRDGGYTNKWQFTDEEVLLAYKTISECGYDYFEIGYRHERPILETSSSMGKWYYSSDDDIKSIKSQYQGCQIAVMVDLGSYDFENFADSGLSPIDLIRVFVGRTVRVNSDKIDLFTDEGTKHLVDELNILIGKGYKVSINIGYADSLTDREIGLICTTLKNLPLAAIYLADSFGSFTRTSLSKTIHQFMNNLYEFEIPLGVHIHDNLENANEKAFISYFNGCRYLDSCLQGLGRGAGNLKTELLVMFLINEGFGKLKLEPIINYYDINEKIDFTIRKNFIYQLSGYYGVHPNYVIYMIDFFGNKISSNFCHKIIEQLKKDKIVVFSQPLIDNCLKNGIKF
jgi:CMP-N-acetylneuraminic acid synthetase